MDVVVELTTNNMNFLWIILNNYNQQTSEFTLRSS